MTESKPCAGFKRGGDQFQHHTHDVGDAGHDDDVADAKAGSVRNRVRDQRRAVGNPSHAQARGRQLKASAGVVFGKRFFRPWIDADRNTERVGDTVGGNIIMRRADTTGRENIVVAGPERV